MAKGKPARGGKRLGAGRKEGDTNKDPRALMKDMGFEKSYLSPLEFCLAVINKDNILLGNTGRGAKGVTLSQRIESARIAAPYFHQKLPELVEQNVTHSWADMVKKGEERLRTMRKPREATKRPV